MILCIVSVTYIATTVATACDTLMPSTILLLILCIHYWDYCTAYLCTDVAAISLLKTGFQQTCHFQVCSRLLLLFGYSLFFVGLASQLLFLCRSIDIMTTTNNLTLTILSRAIKIAKVTCSSWAHITWALAGQKRYAAAEWERAWARSPRALSGRSDVADSPLPWSVAVSISFKGRCSVCASLWSLKLRFILFYSTLVCKSEV